MTLVGRAAAFHRLDRMAPVTVLETLPGFGKTTLVAEWVRSKQASGVPAVWLRVTRDLDDVTRFLAALHEGLIRAGAAHWPVPEHAGPEPSRGTESFPASIPGRALLQEPVIVVLDDAHLASEPVIDALLDVVRASPLHAVVCCDLTHVVHQVAARHGLETNVLRGVDLSVSAPELPSYAAAWGHALDSTAARLLHELVGGWLLPLRLVLDATPGGSAFHTHVADEFLLDRVLPRIADEAELALAMRFAVPAEVDEELAAAVLAAGRGVELGGDGLVRALEQEGLLWRVTRDDGQAVWRYPTLLRRALLERFELTDPDEARTVHREVARTLLRRREPDAGDLLRHARSARDWALLDQLWAERGWSLAGADPDAFRFAYADLPVAVTDRLTSLALAGSLGDALAGTTGDGGWMQRVEVLLRRYTQAGSDYVRRPPRAGSGHPRADMLTAAMIASRTDGRLEDARRLAAAAAREYAVARAAEPAVPRSSQRAWFELQNAVTQLSSSRFASALELAGSAYQTSPDTLVGAGASGLAAAMHAISGQPADARHWLAVHDGIDLDGHWAAGLAQLPARIARAMLAYDRLDDATGEAELEAVQLGAEASGLWPLVLAVRTRHALVTGDPVAMLARLDHVRRVRARRLREPETLGRLVLERCSVDLALALGEVNRVQARLTGSHDLPSWLVVPAARFHLMTGDARATVRIAAAGAWRRDIHVRDRLQLLVVKSLALRELGKHPESVTSLRRAHSLAADTANLEPYLLLPRDGRLAQLAVAGVRLEPAEEALLRAGRQLYPTSSHLVQLSPRELEVLREMRHHDTVAGLARSLSVSVNTVKKQLVSLYAKLEVHDRVSALLRAERLGFLEAPEHPSP